MIDIIKQTPAEYSNQSRDYQIIARLYTMLFNYSKLYIDDTNIWDSSIDNKLINLRAKTLNFDARHTWDFDDLEAVTSCFKYLVRKKGTSVCFRYCINILLRSLGMTSALNEQNITIDTDSKMVIVRADVTALASGIIEDLIAYLLPAGWTYRVIKYVSYSAGNLVATQMNYAGDKVTTKKFDTSYKQFIGNDTNKKRFTTHTWVYNTEQVTGVPDQNVSDDDDMHIN